MTTTQPAQNIKKIFAIRQICPLCAARPGHPCIDRVTGIARVGEFHTPRYLAAEDDRVYFAELRNPVSARCGHMSTRYGRTCSRRSGHDTVEHRDGEFGWEN